MCKLRLTFNRILLMAVEVWLVVAIKAYTPVGRFGHSAVVFNNSIYFYGGDSSITSSTKPAWKALSGPQNSLGGPVVFSQVAFMGGRNGGSMILVGGVMPVTEGSMLDDISKAYSYDCNTGRWSTISVPSNNYLNRQGAASSVTSDGIAYIWGGKRANTNITGIRQPLPSNMYRFDTRYPNNSTLIPTTAPTPFLRYAHSQTLISDRFVVVLGGFDSLTGEAASLADVWIFDLLYSQWRRVNAKLDNETKPANRSSHSEVLMPDGVSILIYGGYDGYHVYNDVAVLDTRSWTWSIKNTNAAVQGRAEHTATLIGTNMIVAFGFTGVSTALTVMSDIEILDTTTWSWTSMYIPSPGYGTKGDPWSGSTSTDNAAGSNTDTSSSMAIVAGAVTGVLVVFVLILIMLYVFNYHRQRQKRQTQGSRQDVQHPGAGTTDHPVISEELVKETPILECQQSLHRDRTQRQAEPFQSTIIPSPWPQIRQSYPPATSDWNVRRAATFAYFSPSQLCKPDEPFQVQVRRAATTPAASSSTHLKQGTEDDEDALFDQQEFVLRTGVPSLDEHMTVVEAANDQTEGILDPSPPPAHTSTLLTPPFKNSRYLVCSPGDESDMGNSQCLPRRPSSHISSTHSGQL